MIDVEHRATRGEIGVEIGEHAELSRGRAAGFLVIWLGWMLLVLYLVLAGRVLLLDLTRWFVVLQMSLGGLFLSNFVCWWDWWD
jgi:hypothetical protein